MNVAPSAAPGQLHAPEQHAQPFAGALFWVAIAFSVFQIVTAAFSPLSSSVVRAVHAHAGAENVLWRGKGKERPLAIETFIAEDVALEASRFAA